MEGKRGLKRMGDAQLKPKSWVGAEDAAGPERAIGRGKGATGLGRERELGFMSEGG